MSPERTLKRLDAYEALPEPIRHVYSRQQYEWLTDAEKATLIDRECMPEIFDALDR